MFPAGRQRSSEHAQGLGAEASPRIWVDRASQEVRKSEDRNHRAEKEEPLGGASGSLRAEREHIRVETK